MFKMVVAYSPFFPLFSRYKDLVKEILLKILLRIKSLFPRLTWIGPIIVRLIESSSYGEKVPTPKQQNVFRVNKKFMQSKESEVVGKKLAFRKQ